MKNLKITNDFPTNEELNTLFKKVKFPRARKEEYEDYLKETCYSVAVRDNENLVGMAYVTNPTFPDGPYMIYAVAVDPDYQRKGIGSKMISNILDWYNNLPKSKPNLSLYCDLEVSPFYMNFGFIHESLFQMVYHEWALEL